MTVHDQLRMLRHIIETEEFKKRQKMRIERETHDQINSPIKEEPQKKDAKLAKKVKIVN